MVVADRATRDRVLLDLPELVDLRHHRAELLSGGRGRRVMPGNADEIAARSDSLTAAHLVAPPNSEDAT